jgi:hypothetical protein
MLTLLPSPGITLAVHDQVVHVGERGENPFGLLRDAVEHVRSRPARSDPSAEIISAGPREAVASAISRAWRSLRSRSTTEPTWDRSKETVAGISVIF